MKFSVVMYMYSIHAHHCTLSICPHVFTSLQTLITSHGSCLKVGPQPGGLPLISLRSKTLLIISNWLEMLAVSMRCRITSKQKGRQDVWFLLSMRWYHPSTSLLVLTAVYVYNMQSCGIHSSMIALGMCIIIQQCSLASLSYMYMYCTVQTSLRGVWQSLIVVQIIRKAEIYLRYFFH